MLGFDTMMAMKRSDSSGTRIDRRALPAATTLDLDRLPPFTGVTLADPDAVTSPYREGDLVLGVGVGVGVGATASDLIRAVAAASSSGLVLRRPPKVEAARLAKQAATLDLALYWLSEDTDWNDAHQRVLQALLPEITADDSLADLAQTIATLTGGLVIIEDVSARVLAYSRSSDEVDDLRRLSILGRSGPTAYLELLRQWGVYDQLATSEQVIEIAEHPETGIRRRLAVGVFAGTRQLGTIWVQQGGTDFPPHAKQALLGAARVTAAQLAEHRGRSSDRDPTDRLAALLIDRGTPGAAGSDGAGRAARQPCAVVAFDLGGSIDRAADRADLDELAAIITVHAAAYRRNALVSRLDGRVYLLAPSLDSLTGLTAMVRTAVTAARKHVRPQVRAGIGPLAAAMSVAADSRSGADLALSVNSAKPVITFHTARPQLAVAAALDALAERQDLSNPALEQLAKQEPTLAHTLAHYLSSGSDVAHVAQQLHVHATTVRHRIRKAVEFSGIDLDDPDQLLAAHLQLRADLRMSSGAG
jgi:DNA-binding PucR family transcriptional regulator